MKQTLSIAPQEGFSMMELLVSILILLPIMGAAVGVFSDAAHQHAAEQSSIDANQEARTALEMMTTEIGQAGSHGDVYTTLTSAVGSSTVAQAAAVASAAGLTAGDFVTVDTGANQETVEVTAVGSGGFSGIFRVSHASGTPVRLFALPYTTGVVTPSGMGADASTPVTTLRFYGDINSDSSVQYVEYIYDSAGGQITRSITPVTQSTLNAAFPLVRSIRPDSARFILDTDERGVVTSVRVEMTVQNGVESGGKLEETTLSSRILIPSMRAASALLFENQLHGGFNRLPATPPQVTQWINQ